MLKKSRCCRSNGAGASQKIFCAAFGAKRRDILASPKQHPLYFLLLLRANFTQPSNPIEPAIPADRPANSKVRRGSTRRLAVRKKPTREARAIDAKFMYIYPQTDSESRVAARVISRHERQSWPKCSLRASEGLERNVGADAD